MDHRNNKKKEPWRIVVGILSIAFILYMWFKKDIAAIYATLPVEEAVPLIVTTILVSLAKVAVIAGGILLIKWIAGKMQKK